MWAWGFAIGVCTTPDTLTHAAIAERQDLASDFNGAWHAVAAAAGCSDRSAWFVAVCIGTTPDAFDCGTLSSGADFADATACVVCETAAASWRVLCTRFGAVGTVAAVSAVAFGALRGGHDLTDPEDAAGRRETAAAGWCVLRARFVAV